MMKAWTLIGASIVMLLLPIQALAWYNGHEQFSVPGSYVFVWPPNVQTVFVHIRGAGSSGGGSQWIQFGGGGGSGGYIECRVSRPAQAVSQVLVGAGGEPIPAGVYTNGNAGGTTLFGAECVAFGSPLGGQHAYGPVTGGDGGSGGYGRGTDIQFALPGGQGDASPPSNGAINLIFPRGANAPMGAQGGTNWQPGLNPGGGGAPGNVQLPSGAGGNGQVDVYWTSSPCAQ